MLQIAKDLKAHATCARKKRMNVYSVSMNLKNIGKNSAMASKFSVISVILSLQEKNSKIMITNAIKNCKNYSNSQKVKQ